MEAVFGVGMPLGLAGVSVVILAVSLLLLFLKQSNASAKGKPASGKQIDVVASSQPAGPAVRILFGTQTGTAERFSKQLANELRRKYGEGVNVEVLDLEHYVAEHRLAKETLTFFLMATYGDGDPTDNAADFYNWLCGQADANAEQFLTDLTFGVFGLGNKQYEHFNAVGKRVHKALAALGATPLLDAGLGDDDECIDDDFDCWSNNLLAALDARPALLGVAAGSNAGGEAPPPAWEVELSPPGAATVAPFPPGGSGRTHTDPLTATVLAVRELHTPASGRSCVHVELDISAGGATYEAGDHVAVHPANSAADVAAAAALLGLPLDTAFTLRAPAGGTEGLGDPPPGPLRLADALAFHADLLSSPHRDALLALASCASDPAQAARLRLLGSSSAEGKAEYGAYVAGPMRSLLEVMADHPSARPGLGLFFGGVAPRLQPRFYSISSGPAAHPRAVHITCAVVRERLPSGRVHEGVASTWLARLRPGDAVAAHLRHSHFKLPSEPRAPVVMIGPGTGLAPFRGFLQERAAARAAAAAGGLGRAVLFFGCRRRDHDYIYREELEAAVEGGVLDELHVAFSREGAEKDYVQHRMAAAGPALWALLQAPAARVYVCGDAKHMARDVHRALAALAQAHGGLGVAEAEAWVKQLSDSGRYLKDVW